MVNSLRLYFPQLAAAVGTTGQSSVQSRSLFNCRKLVHVLVHACTDVGYQNPCTLDVRYITKTGILAGP